jgi:hypothetical protein
MSNTISSKAAVIAAGILSIGLTTSAVAANFEYSYANPYSAAAQTYVHSLSNIHLYSEATVRAYVPIAGGATEATTTPGVITYKFDFGTDIVGTASLISRNPTFHWSYSRGHNYLYGSKDGTNWEQLLDVTTPAFGTANSGNYNGLLPTSLSGGNELWIKAELFSFGPNVGCCGGAGRNTAQHSRYDINESPLAKVFALEVDFATPPVSTVPLPAGLPLLGAGLALLGLVRSRRSKQT